MGMSLGLAVARRALLLALVALLVAIVALVAALVVDSGSDTAETPDSDQTQADAAAASADAEVAAAMAEASAASTSMAQEAAAVAEDAAAVAQAAAATAQEAAARAESVAAAATAALESLAADRAEAAAAGASESDSGAEPEPAEAQEDAAAAEVEIEEAGTAEQDGPAAADTPSEATGDETDATGAAPANDAEDAPQGESDQAPADAEILLPGEPFELGPPAGAGLAVVGVSHASVLNVRDVPAGEIIARLDNVMNVGSEPVVYVREADSDALIATLDLNRGVIATGNNRQLPTTIWYEIRMGDAVGWASGAYLSPLGATSDTTAEIVAVLGESPSAPTLDELGRIVGQAVASDEPPSRIIVSGAPTVGDLGEITVDVLGLPDDSVRGFRLHVFAQQDPDSGAFVLKTVESTTICDSHRGVSEEGLCH